MIKLHASFLDSHLLLWGEHMFSGGKGKKRGLHPRAVDFSEISEALAELGVSLKPRDTDCISAIAWLPSAGGTPLSPSGAFPRDRVSIEPWDVPALKLPKEAFISLLSEIQDPEIPSIGKDLAFWVSAMRYAVTFVARQQYLPGLKKQNGRSLAAWEAVILGDDARRVSTLAQGMPHACRALSLLEMPQSSSRQHLLAFVNLVVDYLVRSSAPREEQDWQSSLHERWLSALTSPDATLQGAPFELEAFEKRLKEWKRPIAMMAAAPYRLCFRLEEPYNEENPWKLSFMAQSVEDPSLLLTTEDTLRQAPQKGFHPKEFLLSTLGQAARIYPPIERSLMEAVPQECILDATQAFDFLNTSARRLERAGFGILLPAWWTSKGTKLHLSVKGEARTPPLNAKAALSLDQIVEFDWKVALGEEVLSSTELKTIAELKAPLVKLRGQWVHVDGERIQAAIQYWKRHAQNLSGRDILKMALMPGKALAPGVSLDGVDASGWLGEVIARLESQSGFPDLAPPKGFQGTLRPYQLRGYAWLDFLKHWGLGACLADDMGLGKTIQVLAAIQKDWENGERGPVLIICPTSVVGNWQREAQNFTPGLPVLIHHGAGRGKGTEFANQVEGQAIVVTSYALLQRDHELLRKVSWHGVVLDEAQGIKNPETKQAKAARAIEAKYRVALSGTPVENNIGDLWSIMEFLNRGFLGNLAQFRQNFFVPIQVHEDERALESLKRLTAPLILRRLKSDRSIIDDLPEKWEMKVFCNLTREQASLYQAVVNEAMQNIDEVTGIQRKGVVLATLSKLKQVCNHPAHFLGDHSQLEGRSGKMERLAEMLEEILAMDERALVFTQFAEMGELLRGYLTERLGEEVLFLHGGTPKKQRDQMVDRFQAGGDAPRVFILSLKAGGTGLNLTRASHVFHFDRWWNPAVENQATDRAFRIGQTKNVQVHKFLCLGTLEEKIDGLIEKKQQLSEKVVGTGEAWISNLSSDALKDLFALRADAIGD